MNTVVIIPAFNEEQSIARVLRDIPGELVDTVIVVDNNSSDRTASIAQQCGAVVISEPIRGYGRACLAGIKHAETLNPDIVVFLDADYSDFPQEMSDLLKAIDAGHDLVIGSRMLGKAEPGALLPQARWGNRLAVCLIRILFRTKYTDLGPFRAIRWAELRRLEMKDLSFGWTVEMQVKAAKLGLRTTEVPVSYRARTGVSKITGTVGGTIKAGTTILFTIFRYAFSN